MTDTVPSSAPFKVLYDYSDAPTLRKFALSNARVRCAMGPFGCLSGDTEFLTPNGWKFISEFSKGDKVAQYHLDSSRIFFPKTGKVY